MSSDVILEEPPTPADIEEHSTDVETVQILNSDPILDVDENLQLIADKDCFTLNSNFIDVIDVDKETDDVEIIENNELPIVIDDDNDCIDVNAKAPAAKIKDKQLLLLDEVCNENPLLSQIIEECLNLDNSGSMKRIIHKTLIPLYLNCDSFYKNSEEFDSILKRTICKLATSPHLKYSHVKNLCQSLKYDHVQKRLRVIKNNKRKLSQIKHYKKRKKIQTIDLSKEEGEVRVISDNTVKNTHSSQRNHKNTEKNVDKTVRNEPIIPNQNKENIVENIQSTSENNEVSRHNGNNEVIKGNSEVIPSQELLEPYHAIIAPMVTAEASNDNVESIENQIKDLKKELAILEQMEVDRDDFLSPYVRCEQIKAKIVKLYKKLCKIMGTESIKRHEVKFKVAPGHPEGPARCLQEYINDNIDQYGNPPFPDIFDVVECVDKANRIYKLNWNRKQIVREAESLLQIYGNAIQKRRMKREWKDMVALCKNEVVGDPADSDPLLEAKLLKNSQIAKTNENEIFNKFAQLETENTTEKSTYSLTVNNDDETDSEQEDDVLETSIIKPNNIVNNTNTFIGNNIGLIMVKSNAMGNNRNNNLGIVNNCYLNVANNTTVGNNNLDIVDNINLHIADTTTNIAKTNNDNVNTVSNNTHFNVAHTYRSTEEISAVDALNAPKSTNELLATVTNIIPVIIYNNKIPISQNRIGELGTNSKCADTTSIDSITYNRTIIMETNDSDSETMNNQKDLPDKNMITSNSFNELDKVEEKSDVEVKQEREDVTKLLEELGSDFTATVFDIEDPFLVIEVSDSSESEDEDVT